MARRVVTGHNNGKAVVVIDGHPPRSHVFEKCPGMGYAFAWATPEDPWVGVDGPADSVSSSTTLLPKAGQTRLLFLTIPPDAGAASDDFDLAGFLAEFIEHQPEMAALQEIENPGMHRTDSIDYVFVLDGEVYLELDDQKEVLLQAQDVVIQNGTRHAWRNKSDRPATLGVVLVGARRNGE